MFEGLNAAYAGCLAVYSLKSLSKRALTSALKVYNTPFVEKLIFCSYSNKAFIFPKDTGITFVGESRNHWTRSLSLSAT